MISGGTVTGGSVVVPGFDKAVVVFTAWEW